MGDLRENETITVQPVGVLGVELHEVVEQDVSDRRHAPRLSGLVSIQQWQAAAPMSWARRLTWEHQGVQSC